MRKPFFVIVIFCIANAALLTLLNNELTNRDKIIATQQTKIESLNANINEIGANLLNSLRESYMYNQTCERVFLVKYSKYLFPNISDDSLIQSVIQTYLNVQKGRKEEGK